MPLILNLISFHSTMCSIKASVCHSQNIEILREREGERRKKWNTGTCKQTSCTDLDITDMCTQRPWDKPLRTGNFRKAQGDKPLHKTNFTLTSSYPDTTLKIVETRARHPQQTSASHVNYVRNINKLTEIYTVRKYYKNIPPSRQAGHHSVSSASSQRRAS